MHEPRASECWVKLKEQGTRRPKGHQDTSNYCQRFLINLSRLYCCPLHNVAIGWPRASLCYTDWSRLKPKLCVQKEKPPKRGKRGKRQSIGDEDFGQSALLDDELRGTVNARTIAAASMEMARPKQQPGRQQQRT